MRFEFTLSGTSPLLMHNDAVEWADEVGAWRLDANNAKKKGEQSGDDRRPSWTWLGYCYEDGEYVGMPSVNLQACLRKAGSRVPLSGKKTFKELAVSGILFRAEYLAFFNSGKRIPSGPLADLKQEPLFSVHADAVRDMGFKLDVRRTPINNGAKHVRVRPRFEQWAVTGTLELTTEDITEDTLKSIFEQAGRCGLGDWRPSSPRSPGPFGMFDYKLKKLK